MSKPPSPSTRPSLCTTSVHELLPNTWLKSVIKASRTLLSCAALGLFLAAAVSPTLVSAAATGAPGTPSLSPSDYNGNNSVAIIMNMWWGNNGTSWQLYQNGTLVYSANLTDNSPNAQTATSATISNLALGTYSFTAKLINSFGTTASSALSYTVTQAGGGTGPTIPATPTGLTATVNSSSQITVTWTASSGATSYDLQVDGTVHTGVTSPYVSSGLASNSSHTYSVRADNSAGDSAYSASVSATTQTASTAPATPTGLTATVNSSSQITVTWTASSGASSYDLQVDGTVHTGATSPYVNSGLAASSSHTYSVRADNSVGDSAYSSSVSATTQAAGTAPATPTGLTATVNSSSQITVTWTASSGATSYDLQVDGTVHTGATSPYVNSGLAASSSHTYSVRADNSVGDSAYSSSVSATTQSGTTGTLPKHIMSGYWHTWSSGPGFIPLAQIDQNWDVVNVAFAAPTAPGATDGHMVLDLSGFPSTYTAANFTADIKTMQGRGKKIVISLSGYTDYFSLTSSASVTTFVSDMEGIISQYGFDGVDIDLEQTSIGFLSDADPNFKSPVSPTIVNMISALQQITSHFGSNFMLTWAPETFYVQLGYEYYGGLNPYVDVRAGDYLPMIYALRNQTTYVQTQLYNSGTILGADGNYYSMGDEGSLVEMCKMLLTGFNVNENASYPFPALLPSQVVIGVPASAGAAGSGQVSNAVLQQAFSTLNSAYPGFRGIMAWSINWDNFQNANSFADSNKAFLNSQP